MELINAAKNYNIERVSELLDSGEDPDVVNRITNTPLILLLSRMGYTEIVELFLEYGADPNVKNRYGHTPLIMASREGHSEIVKLLLESGVDPNIRDNDGDSPLILASQNGHTEIVKLLLESSADINIQNNDGDTPLIVASREGHSDIVKLIQEYIDLQRIQRMQRPLQNLAFMKYFLDRDDLDIDTASKIFSNERSYNPEVSRRIRDEQHRNMILEEENNRIADYLNTIEQYGSGKRSGKRSKKRSGKRSGKRTKKKRNYRF